MKLDIRTKELIAIGASITANCQPCLQHHVSRAVENGVNEEEIAEAIAMGQMIRKGASGKMDKFAASVCLPVRVECAAGAGGCCG